MTDSAATSDLHGRLDAVLRGSPRLMRTLAIARDLALPDWRIVSARVKPWVFIAVEALGALRSRRPVR